MSSPCLSRMRPLLEVDWPLMQTSSVGSVPGWNHWGRSRKSERNELRLRSMDAERKTGGMARAKKRCQGVPG
jgi:hypothetical protein